MYYVYIIMNRYDSTLYIGYTSDLKTRFRRHNAKDKKWELVYYEAYKARRDAHIREKRLKYYGKALGQLKRRIIHSLVIPKKVRGKGEKAR
jgi:predicted GIY-YIG superfamily endonuclease